MDTRAAHWNLRHLFGCFTSVSGIYFQLNIADKLQLNAVLIIQKDCLKTWGLVQYDMSMKGLTRWLLLQITTLLLKRWCHYILLFDVLLHYYQLIACCISNWMYVSFHFCFCLFIITINHSFKNMNAIELNWHITTNTFWNWNVKTDRYELLRNRNNSIKCNEMEANQVR